MTEQIYCILLSIIYIHLTYAAAAAKSHQSCPTLCDPIDGSLPGSPVPGILQARTLEWVAISFSNAWKWKVEVKSLSRVWLFATPWTAAHQAPRSMGFSRQECWSGVPLPSVGTQTSGYQRGEGRTNEEFGISRYKLLHIKYITNKDLLYSTENCTQYLAITYNVRKYSKNVYIYIHMHNWIGLLYTWN